MEKIFQKNALSSCSLKSFGYTLKIEHQEVLLMKKYRFILALCCGFMLGFLFVPLIHGQDESGESVVNQDDSGTQNPSDQPSDEPPPEPTADSAPPPEDPESPPPEENQTFVCAKCGYTTDSAGDCPGCNEALSAQNNSTEGESGSEGDSGNEGSENKDSDDDSGEKKESEE
jgi:hypothetical protein